MTRTGVPPYDGSCGVCDRDGFRDALQYVNHVGYIHADDSDKREAEREMIRALAHLYLGEAAADEVDPTEADIPPGGASLSCPLCTSISGSDVAGLVQHGRNNHKDRFDELAGGILSALGLYDGGRPSEDPRQEEDSPSSSSGLASRSRSTGLGGSTSGGSSTQIQIRGDSGVTAGDVDSGLDTEVSLETVMGTTESSRRRKEIAQNLLELFFQRFALDYEEDEHGVFHVDLPRQSGRAGTVNWKVAFDKETAKRRHVDYVNYTNPHFQRILRYIRSDPVLALRLVQEVESPGTLSDEASYEVLKTDFSFHVEYRTYGRSREELIRLSVGDEDLGNVLVTDAFQPDAIGLPDAIRDHYDSAKNRLADHLSERAHDFCEKAREARLEEEETLEQFEHEHIPDQHGKKRLKEDEEFYRSAIQRYRESLDSKYEVVIESQLLTVEPYLEVGGTQTG